MTKEDFKNLFDLHFDDVRRYLLYRSGNEELATDIAQDTFMRIWEKQMNIDPKTSKGLLFKIANDLFITKYRKDKLAFHFFKHFKFEEAGQSPEELVEFEQTQRKYENSLKKMPEKQRTVFLLSRDEELKYREIALQVGISVKAVEKRMKNALDYLRMNLDQNE